MEDVQRPKAVEEVEVEAEAEVAAHLKAGTTPLPEPESEPEPEPEPLDPTEHYRRKKGIMSDKTKTLVRRGK